VSRSGHEARHHRQVGRIQESILVELLDVVVAVSSRPNKETASGKLGTMLHIEGHNSNENSNSVLSGWRLSPEESPGGGLTGAGLHILDAFVSMLGPVRRVYAQVNSHRQGPPPLDTAIVMLDFANGVTGTLATVRATPFLLARSRLRNEGLCRGIG